MTALWEGLRNLGQKQQPSKEEIGTGPAAKCDGCGEVVMKKLLEEHLGVCPHCDHHHRLPAHRRLEITLDPDAFEELNADIASTDILDFKATKSYDTYIERAVRETGMLSALVTGLGRLGERPVAAAATDSRFIMGSMGSALGEKFVRLAERALEERVPFLVFACSGGARMHEGLFSLLQMAKTSAVLGKLREARLPYLVVCTDPTTAGVWASWASLGDIILAEPKALIGFTGARVIKATINCELPPGFQRSEFLLEHGQIDRIIHRRDMRKKLIAILDTLCGPTGGAGSR